MKDLYSTCLYCIVLASQLYLLLADYDPLEGRALILQHRAVTTILMLMRVNLKYMLTPSLW